MDGRGASTPACDMPSLAPGNFVRNVFKEGLRASGDDSRSRNSSAANFNSTPVSAIHFQSAGIADDDS